MSEKKICVVVQINSGVELPDYLKQYNSGHIIGKKFAVSVSPEILNKIQQDPSLLLYYD
jgi:hypothetical protein